MSSRDQASNSGIVRSAEQQSEPGPKESPADRDAIRMSLRSRGAFLRVRLLARERARNYRLELLNNMEIR